MPPLSYMRERALSEPVIARLAAHTDKQFADPAAWQAHLEQLGITQLTVTPNPMQIATEGALWGSIQGHGFLQEGVIVSDDAGQFSVGKHALCWIHAERLVHKPDTFTDHQRAAQQLVRSLISAALRGGVASSAHGSTISSAATPASLRANEDETWRCREFRLEGAEG